MLITTACLL